MRIRRATITPLGVGAAVACALYDIAETYDTFSELGELHDRVDALNKQIQTLQAKCNSEEEQLQIQQLQQQALQLLAEYTKRELRGYVAAIAVGAVCLAVGALL